MQTSTIMVTGGAGFIGSELVRQLAQSGSRILVVDSLVNGSRENVEDVLSASVALYVDDIRDVARMDTLMRGVDLVYHLACLGVRHSIHSPHDNHDVNATATLGLLDLARKHGVDRFVYVSSSEVYGTATQVPMTEQHPTFPKTVYGSGKLAGECYARAYHHTYDFPTVVLRPFNSFGPRCHHEGDPGAPGRTGGPPSTGNRDRAAAHCAEVTGETRYRSGCHGVGRGIVVRSRR